MLTKELGIAVYKNNRVFPDRLSQGTHGQYLDYAKKMLAVYRDGTGKTRNQLHKEIANIFADEPDCPVRRIDAFCKLLDDASEYRRDIPVKAANLRKKVLRLAAPGHPLVKKVDRLFDKSEEKIKERIAKELDKPWPEIEADFFADVTEYHRLLKFLDYPEPRDLLSRYNVAQVQVALYKAVQLTILTGADFKTILRYAKLAKLMHTIERYGNNRYRIHLDGPASTLRQTTRYGVAMAKFLPALISCSDWQMSAKIGTSAKNWYNYLNISHRDKYKSHLPPMEEFDSTVEENFLEKWGAEPRDGWSLVREGEILWKGQKVFLPDFALSHEDGRKVLLEIVGFWTPQYLKEKAATLKLFEDQPILLLVDQSVAEKIPELPMKIITYKSAIILKDVLAYLKTI